jgi:hypothetical protein
MLEDLEGCRPRQAGDLPLYTDQTAVEYRDAAFVNAYLREPCIGGRRT